MTNSFGVSWAAGLFEGEGCIYVTEKAGRYKNRIDVRLVMSSTDQDVIDSFREAVQAGTVAEDSYFTKKYGWKLQYRWTASAKADVRAVLELLRPLMHARRAEKADQALDALDRGMVLAAASRSEAAKNRAPRERSSDGRYT